MTQIYTPTKLEQALINERRHPHIQRELLLEQAQLRNPAVFHYEPKGSERSKVIIDYLNEVYPEPRPFNKNNPLSKTVRAYYSKPCTETLEKVVEHTLNKSESIFEPQETGLYTKTVRFILDSYAGSKKPMMELQGHHTAEHSLDAAMFTLLDGQATLEDALAALLHDWIEDRGIHLMQEHNHDISEKEAIKQSKQYLFKSLHSGKEFLDYKLQIAIEAADIMTLRKGYDYGTNISRFGQEGKKIIVAPHEVIPVAFNAKHGDKDTGIRTWNNFTLQKKIKTKGKTILVQNYAREYMNQKECMRPEVIQRNTQRLAITARRELRKQFLLLQQLLKQTDNNQGSVRNQGIIGANINLLNKSIDEGLLWSFDTADKEMLKREEHYGRTLYTALVLGVTPEHPYEEISPLLQQQGETQEETLKRLTQEKEELSNLLFNRRIKNKGDVNRLAQKNINRQQVVRTVRRMLGLERNQTAFALIPDYSIELRRQ